MHFSKDRHLLHFNLVIVEMFGAQYCQQNGQIRVKNRYFS